MSILKIFSPRNPRAVPEFLGYNINWLDVLSKIWYHNFVDDFSSQKKQKSILLEKLRSLHCVHPIILWTAQTIFIEDWISDFLLDLTSALSTSGKRYSFWVRPSTKKHFAKIKSNIKKSAAAKFCHESAVTGDIFPRNSGNGRYFPTRYRRFRVLFPPITSRGFTKLLTMQKWFTRENKSNSKKIDFLYETFKSENFRTYNLFMKEYEYLKDAKRRARQTSSIPFLFPCFYSQKNQL